MIRVSLSLGFLLLVAAQAGEAPAAPAGTGWRGDGHGVYPGATLPTEWDGEKNLAWSAEIGWSYSSLIAHGEHVIALAEPNKVLCVSAAEGKIRWTKELTPEILPEDQRGNVQNFFDPAETSGNSAITPLTDGTRVFVVLGNGIVACLDAAKGEVTWARHIATEPTNSDGRSASPVLAGGKLLVHLSALFALDPASGKVLWKQEEAEDSFGTCGAGKIGEVDIVVTPMGKLIRVGDGKVLAEDLGALTYATPLIQDGILYMIGSDCAAFRLPEKIEGDRVDAQKIWEDELADDVYASSVIHEGLIYALPASGKLVVFDMKHKTKTETPTGLDEGAEEINIYPSVTLAGKHLYLFNDKGKSAVFTLGAQPRLVGHNQLPEGAAGTPAVSGQRLFTRGGEMLFCIGR